MLTASVVVTSYNYARFLRDAIDSALDQTVRDVEVVVVDDGSTDGSVEIVRSYGDRVRLIEQHRAGQAAAFNQAFESSLGELVLFLDADDVLAPDAVAMAAKAAAAVPGCAKVHWPMRVVDGDLRDLGRRRPEVVAAGDLRAHVLREGPANYSWPPTSGNAWTHEFLRTALPMPTREYRIGADFYLAALAPLFGPVVAVVEPLSSYRVHGTNNTRSRDWQDYIDREYEQWRHGRRDVLAYCDRHGLRADHGSWEERGFVPRLRRVSALLSEALPPGRPIVLLDDDEWNVGPRLGDRPVRRVMEREGCYDGPPADGVAACSALEAAVRDGTEHVVIGWPSFWWLEHYSELADQLAASATLEVDTDDVKVFRVQRRDAS